MGEHDGHRERLRNRFQEHGMDVLQDHEVLELLLFYALPRRDTNGMARALLKYFGSLAAVLEATPAELKKVAGIGEYAAMLLRMVPQLARRYQLSKTAEGVCLTSTHECGEYLLPYFFGATEELIYLLCMDGKGKVLSCRLVQRGEITSASFSPRKVAEIAMNSNAATVVLAHNHTAGLAFPSRADIDTTHHLKAMLDTLGINMVDHIIVADSDFVSLAESGTF